MVYSYVLNCIPLYHIRDPQMDPGQSKNEHPTLCNQNLQLKNPISPPLSFQRSSYRRSISCTPLRAIWVAVNTRRSHQSLVRCQERMSAAWSFKKMLTCNSHPLIPSPAHYAFSNTEIASFRISTNHSTP